MVCTKVYTAIFVSKKGTRAENVTSIYGEENAYADVKRLAAMNESLVALVPGSHADWSHTYPVQEEGRNFKVTYVDPFELPDHFEDEETTLVEKKVG